MKVSAIAAVAALAAVAVAGPVRPSGDKYLIELGPGKTQWVTKDQKHKMRAAGQTFIDITNEIGTNFVATKPVAANYPKNIAHPSMVSSMIANLSKENLMRDLQAMSEFNNRYYESQTGVESANWLMEQVKKVIDESGAQGAKVEKIENQFNQFNIIATIPGSSESTVIVGAHQDSINQEDPMGGRAPGADDNGSGSVVVLEALRGVLGSKAFRAANNTNTLEFHWYAGEEGGLLGSQTVFSKYKSDGRQVKAMLNQDLAGFKGQGQEQFGLITDNTNQELNQFCKMIVEKYASIPIVDTECGYACSDHASADRNGFPASMVAETAFEDSNPHIHSADDTVEYLDFDHMLEHAKVALGFMTELGMASNL
ncbi:TPA_exp: putative leucine aminopeptidase [Trichophyton benhamiae CBS 112371]|uniref:Probable leucine aminopeptidase ARB_03492 n=1 Tax=Arthroderma benhamiae (strain ATCC MYA-4681 / CBS 112371) TaxID=663331 RepID=LAP3_ARTBC|nr:uncharacterized protein ARB_03492 [Trichophyton benhamiae CBS 112371]D4B4V2.1 RecName: Full=Probable leucine aminopeptidase ARB_03492; AltName: Full=Leucyl aminopeptidase ARB_03492; Flags: Precursor [Trichophyton benhamiae CBS 112371]EFE29597.1 hypothetical protein ARB_03492 [Trichophyton benhamiae CBS 112371]DAA72863.1 TPA_exp: putative leucine aminopeptidase [Trichophyton benhamiae CBS 112371]